MATFAEKYGAKYEKAVTCLTKDRDALLTFYDFPAEHWDHLRTSNPIESVFATVRHRTVRTKGALSQDTARLMVFKLVMAAAKTWRRLKGENQLPKVIQGVTFRERRRGHQHASTERRLITRHPNSGIARRIFTRNGKPFVATRDAGGFHETHTTLALLINSHAGSEVSSRGDTLHQVAAADAASAKEMESERGTGGAQEVPSRQPATGPRTSARGVRRRQ